jgi:caffeoyl-CoA O-methyltransferase
VSTTGTPTAGRSLAAPRPVTPNAIVAELLTDLVRRVEAGDDIDESFRTDLHRASALAAGLDAYLEACTTPASPDLQRLAATTQQADWSAVAAAGPVAGLEQEMLSGHVEGQLLRMLVQLTGARRVLDVGMFTGYSSLAMAEALPDGGRVVACELAPAVAAIARQAFDASEAGDRISIEVGPAVETIARLAADGATFDMAFLDADKPGYLDCFELLLDRGMVGPGGLICADNTLLQGEAYLPGARSPNGAAIAAFNAAVTADDRVEQVMVPLRDGVTLIRVV